MKEERINEMWAILLLAVTVIALVSLLTFDTADLTFYASNPNRPVHNFAGIAGAYLAGALMFAVGKASFVFPLVTFLWAVGRFTGREIKKFYIKLLGAAVLVMAVSSFLSMVNGHDSTIRFSSGGVAGLGFSTLLIRYFGAVGAYVIIIALSVLSLLLATEFLIFPLLFSLFKGLGRLFLKIRSSFKPIRIKDPARKENVEKPRVKTEAKILMARDAAKKTKIEIKRPAPAPITLNNKPERIPARKEKQAFLKAADKESKESMKSAANGIETKGYILPTLDILDSPPPVKERELREDLEISSKVLEDTLADFGLEVRVVKIEQGPVITRYELEPAPGIKISKISNLSDNISLAMKATSVRIVAPIPGKGTVGVEVPNSKSVMVYLKEVLESDEFKNADSKLTMALGKDISGHPVIADLSDMPHLLIAGATGSGKTVCVNSIIASILFNATPDEVKFVMVDPKMVELSTYNNIPHLICPVVTDHKKVSAALNWIVNEMENRYKLFAAIGARNITIYNKKLKDKGDNGKLAYILVIIDELADLMAVSQQEIESAITRLAQLSRAVGIHIILATQRPSVDVITGIIKANFPARISFKVASKVDSRTVLDMNGADKLLGKGDMLFIEPGAAKPVRAQGGLVSDGEIERLVKFIKDQRGPDYNEDMLQDQKKSKFKTFDKDEVYEEAVKLVLQTKQASVSMLQRRLGVGYTRAARLVDMMEDEGIVGPYAGSKPRDILVEEYEQEGLKEEMIEEAKEGAAEEV
ncbi:MAG: DNA translocase FtsK [Candidatus Omnitrophota bacterium]